MWPLLALLLAPTDYFRITAVDSATGRGIPLVELRTTSRISLWTDSNGIAAFLEPGLMDREVHFSVTSPGYTLPGDSVILHPTPGGRATLRLLRTQPAERLYRVTGQGIYADSLLTGASTPLKQPALNAQVVGQDTVRATPYRGRLFWLWGDTDRPDGPLGNFNTTTATSEAHPDPSKGVDLSYHQSPNGFVQPALPWTRRMTWMHALMRLNDDHGRERLVAYYEVIRSLGHPERAGLAVWNDGTNQFDPLVEFPEIPKIPLESNAIPVETARGPYFYFAGLRTGVHLRVPANWAAIQNLASYELLTNAGNRPVWQPGAVPASTQPRARFLDIETGDEFEARCWSFAWNPYHQRWIAILQRDPGEVWFAEADTPAGPWLYAVRVASHARYTFYWPTVHPFLDQNNGRTVYFEGTFTNTFSPIQHQVPRYEYNQLMYRLDLDDPRLLLPQPLYRLRDGRLLDGPAVRAASAWSDIDSIPFYALPAARPGSIPVSNFHALPGSPEPPAAPEGLWSCKTGDGLDLSLLIQPGGAIHLNLLGLESTVGLFESNRLSASLNWAGKTYRLEATREAETLKGTIQSGSENTLTCTRPDPNPWRHSKSLVPLYLDNGQPTLQPIPGEKPKARVWQNPRPGIQYDPALSAPRPSVN